MRKPFKSAAAGAGGSTPGMAVIQGWEMHCIQVKSNLCCSGLSVACSPRPKDEVSQVDGCCGDLVVIVVGFNVGFDVTTTSFVGLSVLDGDRVGIALGGFVGPDSTVSYFTVISCGAAHVPPKYNPKTAPCS